MTSLFDRIKILLGMKIDVQETVETSPSVTPQPEIQDSVVPDSNTYSAGALGAVVRSDVIPEAVLEPQKQAEETAVQGQELNHSSELELLKHYAELAKQNKMDSAALNEDLE